MAKFTSKSTGDQLTAAEYNNVQLPREDILTTSGITGTSGDNTQLAKAVANYAAVSTYYTDSGVADAYVLNAVDSFRSPTAYVDGLEVRFRAGNGNTGASTVNVAGLGVKNIKLQDGTTDIPANIITTNSDAVLRYDLANDAMIIGENSTIFIQSVSSLSSTSGSTSTVLPVDSSIPQNTEGAEFTTVSITPKNASNKLQIIVNANLSTSVATGRCSIALFKDSESNARASSFVQVTNTGGLYSCSIYYEVTAGGTTSQTWKLRYGQAEGGTGYINQNAAGSTMGGTLYSGIIINEIK